MIQANNSFVKVALADDHSLVRESLSEIINGFDRCHVITLAKDGIDLMESLRSNNLPDIILLDLDMPRQDGFETAKLLQENYPSIFVVALTMFGAKLPMNLLMKFNVRGVLTKKDVSISDLNQAIKTTMETGYCFSGRQMASILKQGTKSNTGNNVILSDKELEFMKLLGKDLTNQEIADKMEVSVRTVDGYRETLCDKLNVKTKLGLALYAIRNGLMSGEY